MLRSVCMRKNCYPDARVNTDPFGQISNEFYRGWASKHLDDVKERKHKNEKINHRWKIEGEDAAGKGIIQKSVMCRLRM